MTELHREPDASPPIATSPAARAGNPWLSAITRGVPDAALGLLFSPVLLFGGGWIGAVLAFFGDRMWRVPNDHLFLKEFMFCWALGCAGWSLGDRVAGSWREQYEERDEVIGSVIAVPIGAGAGAGLTAVLSSLMAWPHGIAVGAGLGAVFCMVGVRLAKATG